MLAIRQALEEKPRSKWNIAGRGSAGIIAAYAIILQPREDLRMGKVVLVDPPTTHREGPIFLHVLRILDIPEALGLMAPRSLTICTDKSSAYERTASIYRAAGGMLKFEPIP